MAINTTTSVVDYNGAVDAALAVVDDRIRHWQSKRERRGHGNFPVGQVENELLLVRQHIEARKK